MRPGPAAAVRDRPDAVGALGYTLGPDVRILDTLGLADAFSPRTWRRPREPLGALAPHWLAGHEKPLPTPWLAARVLREGAPFDETRTCRLRLRPAELIPGHRG